MPGVGAAPGDGLSEAGAAVVGAVALGVLDAPIDADALLGDAGVTSEVADRGVRSSASAPRVAATTMTAAPTTRSRERFRSIGPSVNARIDAVDERASKLVSAWLSGLSLDGRRTLYALLDELCRGIDVSRHNPFGFLRLRAEFETSGELFGCTLPDLRDAVAASLGDDLPTPDRPRSALESLREEIVSRGHPDFR
jgi:hypothetical protein